MEIDSLCSASEIFSSPEIEKDFWGTEFLSKKIHSVWTQIYDTTTHTLNKAIHISRRSIGAVIRDGFFFPLKCPLIANLQYVQHQLHIEQAYCRDFWDPSKPLDPNFRDQAKIRDQFEPPVDRPFSIVLKSGKTAQITCRIMETKTKGPSFYNFIQVPGIHSTIDNNVGAIAPYLLAYLNAKTEEKPLPPARFIVISENNFNFKPADVEEAGSALLETLRVLREEYGEIDQLVAHSLGNIFSASALKQIDDPKLIPKHICLDRGPSSIKETSKKYFFGLGRLMYFLAEFGGWGPDIEKDVVDFCEKWKSGFSLTVTGVELDHYFSGRANLCLGERIKKIKNVEILVFNPPLQIIHEHGHHNWGPNFFNKAYLTAHSSFINDTENLSDAIIRHSLPAVY